MQQELEQAIEAACQASFGTEVKVELTRPDEQFGDYATNVALQLAKQLGKNPREVAEALVENLKGRTFQVQEMSVAGPGFINLRLTDEALVKLAEQPPAQSLAGKTVVAEYSDPNPFKVLHAGHLYTTITGDAIAKLLETAGATVHRLNYGGDVGLHVARTMWALTKELGGEDPEKMNAVPEKERLDWLSNLYVKGTTAYEEDESAKAEIISVNKRVYQLHADNDHESPFAQIYWTGRQWSYQGFEQLYKDLQISPFEKFIPESEVTPLGLEMVQKGITANVFEKSDGAVIFPGEKHDLHTRVFLNSEGLPTYEAKDLGLAGYKWQNYHFDLSVIVTANDIVEYMKVVLKALSLLYPEIPPSRHFTHGVIKLPGAVKMSSRKGNILRASDILNTAMTAIKESGREPDDTTMLAAVKYAFLKQRIGGDIVYDPAESVALEGNSGPYLQYAHARARSILKKSGAESPESSALSSQLSALDSVERSLLRKISEYAEVVDRAVQELMPHHTTTYLYELAQVFNSFYEHNRVLDDPRQAVRLQLVQRYADTLKNGLELLNIPAPERM